MKSFVVSRPDSTALRALNYSPAVEHLKNRTGTADAIPLGKCLADLGSSYGSVFTRLDCLPPNGIELLSQGDMFSVDPQGRQIRRDSIPRPELHAIEKWDVLIAGAGTLGLNELYGNSIVADGRLVGKYVGPHAMKLRFLEPGGACNLTAYVFFLTKIGVEVLRSASYGTKILGIRKDILSSLPMPVLPKDTTERIARLVRTAVEGRERFSQKLGEARSFIERLPSVQEAAQLSRATRVRSLVWDGSLKTLCAWNYASAGEALRYLQKVWAGRLGDVVTPSGIFNGLRFARIPCEEPFGVWFWSQRDVFSMRPLPRRIAHPGFDDRLLTVADHSILIGSHGQLNEGSLFGRAELAQFGASGSAVTQDILRVNPKPAHLETLYAFLATDLGTALLRATAVGTSVPSMHLQLLSQLPVPDLDSDTASAVRQCIREAISARRLAASSEEEAVAILEREALPEWLN